MDHERISWARALSQVEYDLAQRGLFTVKAAAAYLLVSTNWIYEQIRDGRLTARKVGKRFIIQQAELDKILASA